MTALLVEAGREGGGILIFAMHFKKIGEGGQVKRSRCFYYFLIYVYLLVACKF